MDSAFYYLGISDVIPNKKNIVTKRDFTKFKEEDVIQIFMDNKYYEIGKINFKYNESIIPIYNKERMLIELIRFPLIIIMK